MQRDVIEDMVIREFKDLCSTCLHAGSCAYFMRTPDKLVIQCEMFETVNDSSEDDSALDGLCKNCDLAAHCRLPGRKTGTWHCNEFQ